MCIRCRSSKCWNHATALSRAARNKSLGLMETWCTILASKSASLPFMYWIKTIFEKNPQPVVTRLQLWWPCWLGNWESRYDDAFIRSLNHILFTFRRMTNCSIIHEHCGGQTSYLYKCREKMILQESVVLFTCECTPKNTVQADYGHKIKFALNHTVPWRMVNVATVVARYDDLWNPICGSSLCSSHHLS